MLLLLRSVRLLGGSADFLPVSSPRSKGAPVAELADASTWRVDDRQVVWVETRTAGGTPPSMTFDFFLRSLTSHVEDTRVELARHVDVYPSRKSPEGSPPGLAFVVALSQGRYSLLSC